MSEAISGILAVLKEIQRERAAGGTRTHGQVRIDTVKRIAEERDVRPAVVLETIAEQLRPEISSVAALERAIDGWLGGRTDLRRILQKNGMDQIDDRSITDFFRDAVAAPNADTAQAETAVIDAPRAAKKAKSGKKAGARPAAQPELEPVAEDAPVSAEEDDAHAKAEADALVMAEAAVRAAAEEAKAAAEAEELGRSQAEARARAQTTAQAAAEARARAEAAAQAAAAARAKADAAAQARAKARARDQAERTRVDVERKAQAEADEEARATEEQESAEIDATPVDDSRRTVTLDDDVAAFFADERAVNDFLRAAISAMGSARRHQNDDA